MIDKKTSPSEGLVYCFCSVFKNKVSLMILKENQGVFLISQNQLSLVFGRTQHIPDGIKLVGQIVDQNRGVMQMVH